MKPIDEAETAAGSVTSDSNSPCPSDTGVVDVNGTDLDSVLYNAVRNPKDRLFVLKLEQQCEAFAKDDSQTQLEFSHMNSYQRLIIYRMAAHFKMVHTPNTLNKGVLIHKNEKSEV
ncbi:single-stranded nucleic acid binding R3H, partial [Gaertneriomyces semiglobifer]